MAASYKLETMLKILNRINSGERTNALAIAEEFGVTRRSAERYIETLRKSGFPIQFDRSRKCYTFKKGFSLQKNTLNDEEALVLALAKSLLKQFGGRTEKVLDTIEKKLGTDSSALPDHIILGERSLPPIVEEHLKRLNAAIIGSNQVEIEYRATYKNDEKTCRVVDPYYLLFKENMWYIRGFCRLRKELRVFALDKIDSLTVLDKHFIKKMNLVPKDELASAFHVVMGGELVDVVLRFDEKVKPYLLRQKWIPSQENKELPDGRLEVRLKVNGFVGLKPWLYGWIPYVEVVAPEELNEDMKKDLVTNLSRIAKLS